MPRRRGPVIAFAITAAALSGAVGVGTAAPAVADGARPGPDAAGPAAGDSSNPGPRRPTRANGSGAAAGSAVDGDGRPGHLCPWWPRPIPHVLPAYVGYSGGDRGLILPGTPIPTTPVPVFGDKPATPADPAALPVVPAFAPIPAAPPVPAAPAGPWYPAAPSAVMSIPAPRAVPTAPIARPAPAPAAVTAAPAGVRPPPSRPAAAQLPAAPAQGPVPVRLGYPDELRDADPAKVLAMALPGLAAMAGMTAFGGLVGYRQARAGYLLRAAGAGRFLK